MATRTPLQDLPAVECRDCNWRRCAYPELREELVKLGLQHITETDGHNVEIVGTSR